MTATATKLRSPYPWFGGKSKVSPLVWERFGDVPNYVEPCFGSGANLLGRPHWPFDGNRIETVNDIDGMVPNFWRAVQSAPDEVAKWADWPVSECDLHARHLYLANEGRTHAERCKAEPDYFDAKIAGWWVWGICQWIGSGWCHHPEWKQLPHLGNAGMGIHRPSQQLPHLGDAGRGEVYDYIHFLSERMRRVRFACGDWSRICGPTPTLKMGLTGIFFDPPYAPEGRDDELYAADNDIGADIREWCIRNDAEPQMRIALCGYAGEGHEVLEERGWEVVEWKARGGYGSQSNGDARENSKRERIWFSPHCLKPGRNKSLFD